MSRLQSFRRIISEDFEEKDRPLISKLAYSINSTFEDLQNILNKNLTIDDNLDMVKKDITVTVNASGIPTTPTIVRTGLKSTCRGIQVIRAINQTSPAIGPTGTPFISFSDNSGQLTISQVTNLQAGNTYTLRVILYP